MFRWNNRFLISGFIVILSVILVPKPPLQEGISFSRALYDREGRLLRITLSSDDKYRLWVPLSRFSSKLVEATLLREDQFFRWHPGFNPVSLLKAACKTYIKGRRTGGSTITMQLARLRFGIKSSTIPGKLYQILRALQIELHYSKDKILEAYLNLAPYGGNIEGAGAASLIYFGKDVQDLTLVEALTLAIIPQSPTKRTIYSKGQKLSPKFKKVRNSLLLKWVEQHPQKKEEYSTMTLPVEITGPDQLPFYAPHFTDSLILEDNPPTHHINTTLDLTLQEILERKIKNYVESQKEIGIYNAAALLVDYHNMEVLAAVGSADYFDDKIQGQVNGCRAKRSPGSSLKPFVYALGIDQGFIHTMTMLKDAPSRFGEFNPENFDGDFQGPIKVRDALIRSRNVPAVQVASWLNSPDFYTFLKRAGVILPYESSYYGLAPVLGGAEITMEEIVRLYAMLANGGVLRYLRYRTDISPEEERRLLSPEACFLILDILKDVPRPNQGFRKEWLRDSLPVFWKTGTSYAFRDAWSIGIFGQYVLAVWIGNFSGEGNPAFMGIHAAAPLFFNIIDALRPYAKEGQMSPFETVNLRRVKVCAISGCLPGPYCPHLVSTWFIPGKSPIKRCNIHRLILVDYRSGMMVSPERAEEARAEVYEFWPSDLLKIFRQAGVPRRVPPPIHPNCLEEGWSTNPGNKPEIISISPEVTYSIRINSDKEQTIPLVAVTDADVRKIYWFTGSQFLAKTKSGETFFWKPKLGKSVIHVIDDQGRSDSCAIRVAAIE